MQYHGRREHPWSSQKNATFWETVKVFKDDDGRYHQFRENSFGQYRMTALSDHEAEELLSMFEESNDFIFEQYLFEERDRPKTTGT